MLSLVSGLKVFWLCLEQVICLAHGTTLEVICFNFLLDYKFLDIVTVTHPFFSMPNGVCMWLEYSKFWKNGKKRDYYKLKNFEIINVI